MKKITVNIAFLFTFILIGYLEPVFAQSNNKDFTILLAGDAIITKPWSNDKDPDFLKLVDRIRKADVAIANLEVVVDDFKGYPQAQSGGTHLAVRAVIAEELAWAGFDMVSAANNHSFDYGAIGVLETIKNIKDAGISIAGIGKDLQAAISPAVFENSKGVVGLVSVTSSFQQYGIASRSRPDMHGRPGPNFCWVVQKDSSYSVRTKDEEANLKILKEISDSTNYVVFSIHWHHHDIKWLQDFARKAIESGADIVFCHGPHKIMPIEIYNSKPIFYSLGDFVFQNEIPEKLPVEQYDMYGLGDDAVVQDVMVAKYENSTKGFPAQKEVWEGLLAELTFKGGVLSQIHLIPMDLGFGKPIPPRGSPRYADPVLGKEIILQAGEVSKDYGTVIEYLPETNRGRINLNPEHK